MPRPVSVQVWLLLAALLATVWTQQQPRFACDSEGSDIICTYRESRVEFLDQTTTWREAHGLCRRRGGFLVPSRSVLRTTLLGELREHSAAHEEFWLGAKYLRNGYYEWLLPTYDDGSTHYELIGLTPAVDPSNRCGQMTTRNNQLTLGWLDCNDTRKVVCFSDEKTSAEIRPAGYQPSLSVLHGDTLIKPGESADGVLVTRALLDGDFHVNITCGAGDSVVKDHFILGKTVYFSSWWSSNFTIIQQVFPFEGANLLNVGTYWCRRYVEGEVDPVVSGRLHVTTTSENVYVLTAFEDSVVRMLQLIFSDGTEDEDGQGRGVTFVEDADRPDPTASVGTFDVVAELENFLRTSVSQISFLALYDFSNSRVTRQESRPVTAETTAGRSRKLVSLIMESSIALDGLSLRGAARSESIVRDVFRCPDEEVEGRTWRRSSYGEGYTASEPACVVPGIPALVERRCRPSFDRAGAQWGPFCAAGVCQDQPHQCELPPPLCPPGFTRTTDGSSEVPSEMCMLLLPGVAFEERGSSCRQRHSTATPWFPRRRLLEVTFLSPPLVNHTLWLPFRRLWSQGPLLPDVLSLLDRESRMSTSLNDELNCTVVTPLGQLTSSSCDERHGVLCATIPLYSRDEPLTFQRSNSRGRPCQSLMGLGSVPADGSERCFAFLCPDTSSPIHWSEASSLCMESNSSLVSLTSQRELDALIRLGLARERPARSAVNLKRHDGQVLWSDEIPLSYPALAPNLSTAEQHTRGILDISRGQYYFVGSDQGSVSCALCERQIHVGSLEIDIFYGNARPGASIFANVTNIQHFVAGWEASLSCFVSTAESIGSFQPVEGSSDARAGFGVRRLNFLPPDNGMVLVELSPSVDFGYLTCGLVIPESGEQIMSNSLVLKKRSEKPSVQEYIIGLRGGQRHSPLCDLTFCGSTCDCFDQTLTKDTLVTGLHVYEREMHPLRVSRSDNGTVISYYYVTLDFNPPLRRRRRQTEVRDTSDPMQATNQASSDGVQVLGVEFGDHLEYVRRARCCPEELTEEPVRLSWPETCGGVSTSEEPCVDGSGRPALRHCLGSPLTGVDWGPVEFHGTSCATVSAVTTRLHRLSQDRVTADNAVDIATGLERLTAESTALTSQDLLLSALTLENIQAGLEGACAHANSTLPEHMPVLAGLEGDCAHANSIAPEHMPIIQQSTVATVSQLMDADRSAIETGTELLAVGPRIVLALEGILVGSFAAGSAPHVTADNIAVRSGDFVGISSSSKDIFESSLRTVAQGTGRSDAFGVESALFLEGTKPNIPVVFLVYRDGRLLHSRGHRVTSQVVSVLLPTEGNGIQFRNQVLVTFRSRPGQCAPAPVCAFWDFSASQWSTRGCWLEKIHNGSDVCRCNHLTNFARIFNYETDVYLSETYHRTLDVITYFGSALSLLGLLLTMLTFVLFRKRLRQPAKRVVHPNTGRQIVMQMSLALTGVYLSFLGSLAATENHVACVCLSALLHFFLLATFGWMVAEAVFQYLRFVRVVGTYISRFMLKASLLVWSGSFVPVICIIASRPHCYDGQPNVCWMDFQSFYYSVALPVVTMMVFNTVMFGRIVYSLNCGREKGLTTNQPERKLALRRLRASLIIFVMLGLPWVFGFLSIRQARLVFAVLFCVCSMMQGFAIFLLMVAGEKGVWELWRSLLVTRCCSADTDTTATSKPVNSATGETSSALLHSKSHQDTKL